MFKDLPVATVFFRHHWFLLLNRSPTISIQVCYHNSPVKTNKQKKTKASSASSLPPEPSLVVQGLRIHLAMQRTLVQSLIQEDSTCCKAMKPVYHSYWSLRVYSLYPATREATVMRSLCTATRGWSLFSTRESPSAATKTQCSKNKINQLILKI